MKLKIKDKITISGKPDTWSSSCNGICPLQLKYPKTFTIEEIKIDENIISTNTKDTSFRTTDNYGFHLNTLIKYNLIKLTKDTTMAKHWNKLQTKRKKLCTSK